MRELLGRYEYSDEKSNKFWEIFPEHGNEGFYIATWGRIGTSGQFTTYDEGTALKKIREKIAKGYAQVVGMEGIHPITKIRRERAKAIERTRIIRAERKAEKDMAIDFMSELRKVK